MANRAFSERLNHELSEIGIPEKMDERVEIFSKVFKTPRFKSAAILNGDLLPDPKLLQDLATELEVSASWLLGDERSKH